MGYPSQGINALGYPSQRGISESRHQRPRDIPVKASTPLGYPSQGVGSSLRWLLGRAACHRTAAGASQSRPGGLPSRARGDIRGTQRPRQRRGRHGAATAGAKRRAGGRSVGQTFRAAARAIRDSERRGRARGPGLPIRAATAVVPRDSEDASDRSSKTVESQRWERLKTIASQRWERSKTIASRRRERRRPRAQGRRASAAAPCGSAGGASAAERQRRR